MLPASTAIHLGGVLARFNRPKFPFWNVTMSGCMSSLAIRYAMERVFWAVILGSAEDTVASTDSGGPSKASRKFLIVMSGKFLYRVARKLITEKIFVISFGTQKPE
jgi:hypothetical protein